MEAWFTILVSLCICVLIRGIFSFHNHKKSTRTSLPGPFQIPIISSFLLLRKSVIELEDVLRPLHAKYGPIVTLQIGLQRTTFIADHSLAHQALIQNGAVFSDRPKPLVAAKILSFPTISSGFYGATWRTLRRNLVSGMLNPSRVKSFSGIRTWVLHSLLTRLKSDSESHTSVRVMQHFKHAMLCMLLFMCFGERLNDEKVIDIERVIEQSLSAFSPRFNVLNFLPRLMRVLCWKLWGDLLRIQKERDDALLPLIKARRRFKESGLLNDDIVVSYVDTLLDLQLHEEEQHQQHQQQQQQQRKLNDGEIVMLCSEFLSAGTETTSTALQWIMANLVKYPHVQERLVEEITHVLGEKVGEEREVKEEDLQKLPYLKAVILEGLRRHPPGHLVLPHAVSEDVVFNDYLVPKNGTMNFMVAEMGWDPKVWEDPMAFKPERFLNDEGFDITGSKEIKMMPFGAGRRICPGYTLALLHLEYFVANLVWNFEWKIPEGGDVDLSEKQEVTTVMKNVLQVHISPRI